MSTELSRYPNSSSDGFLEGSKEAELTQALDELRLEVLKTQQAMEEIRTALGPSRIVDYSPSLAAIVQGVTDINEELRQLKEHPALRQTPAAYQHAITESGHAAMRAVLDQLTETRNAGYRTEQVLVGIVGKVRSRREQARWLAITAGAALMAGVLSSPLLARLLPFGLNTHIAAVMMGTDRWQAGARLMQAADPDSWSTIEQATGLWQSNRDAIDACELAAGKRQSTEQCTVLVTPP